MALQMQCNLNISVQKLLMNYRLYAGLFASYVNWIHLLLKTVISQSLRFPATSTEDAQSFNLAKHKKVVYICYCFTGLIQDTARERLRSKLFEN